MTNTHPYCSVNKHVFNLILKWTPELNPKCKVELNYKPVWHIFSLLQSEQVPSEWCKAVTLATAVTPSQSPPGLLRSHSWQKMPLGQVRTHTWCRDVKEIKIFIYVHYYDILGEKIKEQQKGNTYSNLSFPPERNSLSNSQRKNTARLKEKNKQELIVIKRSSLSIEASINLGEIHFN